MAWFDYLQGIGSAAAQGVQQFEGMQQQKRALERQRQLDILALRDKQREQLKEQLQLISPEEELTQEAAKPYLEAFGAGAFTKGTAPGTLRRKLTPEQEATYAALDENRATRAAKKMLQQAIDDGSINTWSDPKLSQITRQAGVDPLMTPGLLTPKRALQFAQSVPKLALDYDTKVQQLAQQLAIAETKAANARADAETRAEAIRNAADIRVRIAELQAEQRTQAELSRSGERRANTVLEILLDRLKDPTMIPKDPKELEEMINTAMALSESVARRPSGPPASATGPRRLGKYAYEQ